MIGFIERILKPACSPQNIGSTIIGTQLANTTTTLNIQKRKTVIQENSSNSSMFDDPPILGFEDMETAFLLISGFRNDNTQLNSSTTTLLNAPIPHSIEVASNEMYMPIMSESDNKNFESLATNNDNMQHDVPGSHAISQKQAYQAYNDNNVQVHNVGRIRKGLYKDNQIKVPKSICSDNNDTYNDNISSNCVAFLLNELVQKCPECCLQIQSIYCLNLRSFNQLNDYCSKQLHNIATSSKLTNLNKMIEKYNSNEKIARNFIFGGIVGKITNRKWVSLYRLYTTFGQRIHAVLQCDDAEQLREILHNCRQSSKRIFFNDPAIKDLCTSLQECYSLLMAFIEAFIDFLSFFSLQFGLEWLY